MSTIDFDLKCAFCFASLNGVELEGVCPTCGREVRATLDRELVDPTTLTVSGDVPCIQCDYNLRTLKIRSVCPECAKPVAASLEPTALSFAGIGYLAEVRSAVGMLLVAILLPVVLFLVGAGALSLISALGFRIVMGVATFPLGMVCLLIVACCWVSGVMGVCKMEPGRPHPRGFGKLSGMAGLLTLWTFAGLVFLSPVSPRWGPVFLAFPFLCLMATMVCVALSIRHLAVRARDRWLRRLATALIVCLSGGMVLLVGMPVSLRILSGSISAVAIILQLWALMVCYALSLVVLIRCHRMLTAVLKSRAA